MSHLPDLLQQANQNVMDIEKSRWQEATGALVEPTHALVSAINEGLEHAGLQLGIIHARLAPGSRLGRKDAESQGDIIQPGDQKFSAYLQVKLDEFSRGRLQSLSAWTSDDDIARKEKPGFSQLNEAAFNYDNDTTDTSRDHRQLNLVLYTHQMVRGIS